MSSVYAHFYAGMQWTALPVGALLLFLATFLAVVVRVSLASRRGEFEADALLPFDDHELDQDLIDTAPIAVRGAEQPRQRRPRT